MPQSRNMSQIYNSINNSYLHLKEWPKEEPAPESPVLPAIEEILTFQRCEVIPEQENVDREIVVQWFKLIYKFERICQFGCLYLALLYVNSSTSTNERHIETSRRKVAVIIHENLHLE
ncbi:Hypothetical_protein [Hexamita inflata]|uniref:Hypothetical_protein n=1 Tax=Hexamita inflata TaxID=28002 RepID=A0AA86TUY3_9EUKA|nr:Hypothetical protein HINF_LOCUS17473 [Hexamita inflata]CAI9929830.1 Hypothetical protein HINF_LOCUS17475 [Hexamita inflata]